MGRDIYARETRFGRYFEEFELGDIYHHWPGKTITEADDHLFCMITMNHHPLHTDAHYAETETQFGQERRGRQPRLLARARHERARRLAARRSRTSRSSPCATRARRSTATPSTRATTVLDKRESQSKPDRGIVTVETVGWNQRDETVCEFRRRVLVPKRPRGGQLARARVDLEVLRRSRRPAGALRRDDGRDRRRQPAPARLPARRRTASSCSTPARARRPSRPSRRRRLPRAARAPRPARARAGRRLPGAPGVRGRRRRSTARRTPPLRTVVERAARRSSAAPFVEARLRHEAARADLWEHAHARRPGSGRVGLGGGRVPCIRVAARGTPGLCACWPLVRR